MLVVFTVINIYNKFISWAVFTILDFGVYAVVFEEAMDQVGIVFT